MKALRLQEAEDAVKVKGKERLGQALCDVPALGPGLLTDFPLHHASVRCSPLS